MRKSRLLIVKLGDMGDTVLLTAAVDTAKRALPEYDIDLLLSTGGAPVFEHDTRIHKMWTFDRRLIEGRRAFSPRSQLAWARLLWTLRSQRYDAVILAHHLTTLLGTLKLASVALATGAPIRVGADNGRGGFLTLYLRDEGFGAVCEGEYWVRLVGLLAERPVSGKLSICIDEASEAKAKELLPEGIQRPLIAMHHGLGGWIPSRAWKAEGFAEVADLLHERFGGTILLVGGPEERAAVEQVASLTAAPVKLLAGETDVLTLAALLRVCDLFIGPDAGPRHVASAVGVPVVGLWGPTNEAAWGPCSEIGSSPAITLRAPDRPEPWIYVGHKMGDIYRPSDLGSITPQMVYEAAVKLLTSRE